MLSEAMKLSTFDLRLFVAIVDRGGISAAARQLGREKSTVSRDLSALEDRLGVRLLQRTTRSVSLTEAGAILLAYARRVVEEVEHAEQAIDALSDEPRGVLRVTAPYAIIRFALAPRLQAFQDRYPELSLNLDPTTRVLDLVEQGIDVALRVGELAASSLVARKLAEARLILVARPDYLTAKGVPLRPGDLAGHRLIQLGNTVGATDWTTIAPDGTRVGTAVSPRLSAPDPGIALDLALEGLGIASAPDLYCADHLDCGRLVQVLPDHHLGVRPIHAVYPTRRQLTPKVRAFVEFAADCMNLRRGGGA
jgi:DNA-binding transcriptional LysR family regulator